VRAGKPSETLTLGLTLTDRPIGARSGRPAETATFGLTLTDRATPARAAGPRDLLIAAVTLTDLATAARAHATTELLTLTDTARDITVTGVLVRSHTGSVVVGSVGILLPSPHDGDTLDVAAGTVQRATEGMVIP
jgi:hypothetical protein